MKAKDFLLQIEKIDKIINNKVFELEQWKAIALGTTAQMGGERVQSSSSQQKMADAVAMYIDIQAEINASIDKLYDTKREVIKVIEQLKATEYDVLHKKYVQGLTFDEIAAFYGMAYTWATTVHGRALKHVQDILDEKET